MNRVADNDGAKSNMLRRALQTNGAFSGLSGVILIVASDYVSALIGIEVSLIPTGILLLVFAIGLFRNARREMINQMEAWIAVALDVAWVMGTAGLIFAGVFNSAGNWIVALVGDIVLLFAVLQLLGLRRLRRRSVA